MPHDDPRARAAELRRQADQIEAEANRREALLTSVRSLRSRLVSIEEDAADAAEIRRQLGAFLGEVKRIVEDEGLPLRSDTDTLDTMDTTPIVSTPRGPRMKSKHPLPKRAKELGRSIPDISRELDSALRKHYPRTTIRSWYARAGDAAREIPRRVVTYFAAAPWSIPESAWRNGISED